MSYTPTEWKTGDVVTAEKLNKLENGIVSGAVYISIAYDAESGIYSIPASYNDIIDSIEAGQIVLGVSVANTEVPSGITAKSFSFVTAYTGAPEMNMYMVGFQKINTPLDGIEFFSTDPDAFMTSEEITPSENEPDPSNSTGK